MKRATGDCTPSAFTLIHTSPFAPACLASAVRSSSSLRLMPQAPRRRTPLPTPTAAPRHAQALPDPAAGQGLREGLELAAREQRGAVRQLEAESQIGLVRAEAGHGLVVGEAREGSRDLHALHAAPDLGG